MLLTNIYTYRYYTIKYFLTMLRGQNWTRTFKLSVKSNGVYNFVVLFASGPQNTPTPAAFFFLVLCVKEGGCFVFQNSFFPFQTQDMLCLSLSLSLSISIMYIQFGLFTCTLFLLCAFGSLSLSFLSP